MSTTPSLLTLSLRLDIEMHPAQPDADGSVGWILRDPLQHRYFRIDEPTHNLFALWMHLGSLGEALLAYQEQTGLEIDQEQVLTLLEFAKMGNLIIENTPGEWRALSERAERSETGWAKRFLHKYLFFKVPLFKPQSMLEATLPLIRPLLTFRAAVTVCLLGLVGLYLVSRQWDSFLHSMASSLSPQGALGFAISLIFLKAAHEMGHAYMAVRFSIRVPVVGIAFMMLTPLLYTDVSDAWKLPSRRKKMLISGAGILVELSLAAIATLLWVFLPDGVGRSIAFMIATTAWIMSLAINLNPCMRFDGYYLLADWLGVDNLQPRAFALGRWKLRQWLLAPRLAPPEELPIRMQTAMVFYAWSTWIYRVLMYTAIALMVYHFAFKLLGIFLFCLEIGMLLIAPIVREVKEWQTLKLEKAPKRRLKFGVAALGVLLVLITIPLPGRIAVPAVLMASDLSKIYTERAGQIVQINVARMDKVEVGSPLFQLRSPKLESEIRAAKIRQDLISSRLNNAMTDNEAMQKSLVLREEYSSEKSKWQGLVDLQNNLVLRSPITGNVVQMAPNLHVGRWVKRGELLALVSSGTLHTVRGYVAEPFRERLVGKVEGRFIPDNIQLPSFAVMLSGLSPANSATIEIAELSSRHSGPIAVMPIESKKLVPQVSQYRIDMTPGELPFSPHHVVRGLVHLDATPESYLAVIFRQISRVLLRESGF